MFQVTTIEQQSRAAALGVRFWDVALNLPVSDGLAVTLQPADNSAPARKGVGGPGGLYTFQNVPGMYSIENQTGEAAGTPKPYLLQIEDPQGRFLPMAVTINLPHGTKGLLIDIDEPDDPLGTGGVVPLFSAPARPRTPGLAAIYGVLAEKATGSPAAFAVLEATVGEATWAGVADKNGNIALLFPYPPLSAAVGGSGGLVNAEWEVSLRVRYKPPVIAAETSPDLPDLTMLLDQSQGRIWPPGQTAAHESWTPTLTYGRALVLSTPDPEGTHGPLLIDPGA